MPGNGVTGSPARGRTTLALIFLSYLIFSFLLFFLSVCLIGRRTLLHHAAQISPYSMIFAGEIEVRDADEAFEDLIFFFGDSSIATVKGIAASRRDINIPGMLETVTNQRYAAPGSLSVVEWAFVGAQPFDYYCMLFGAEKYSPSLVIAPINWRTLGGEDGSPKSKFHELSRLVPPSERFSHSADNPFVLENISLTDQFLYLLDKPKLYAQGLKVWSRAALSGSAPPETGMDDTMPIDTMRPNVQNWQRIMSNWSDSELFKQYPVDITAENTQVRILHLIAETASKRGIPFLFYITPIHTYRMKGRETFDADRFHRSVRTVLEQTTVGSTECVNLIDLLEGEEDFLDYYEHYNVSGNRKIAEALAAKAQKILLKPQARTAF
jgi:hypothetical protein